jgi:hypothetical protein
MGAGGEALTASAANWLAEPGRHSLLCVENVGRGLFSPAVPMRALTTETKPWCGFQVKKCLQAAPVLEFELWRLLLMRRLKMLPQKFPLPGHRR